MQPSLTANREPSALFDTLRSLQRRRLVESFAGERADAEPLLFGLQNVVLEYLTGWLVTTICQELESRRLHFLRSHALLQAQARVYVRQSQERLILRPIVERMVALWGQAHCNARLRGLLDALRQETAIRVGHAAANLLHLLVCGEGAEAADFSHLPAPGVYLRNVPLPRVNFRHADLSGAVFSEELGVVRCVAADPTDRYIAAGAEDGVVFSPGGASLYSGRADGYVDMWDARAGVRLGRMQIPGPYAGMNIRGATGISQTQRASLLALGAVEG